MLSATDVKVGDILVLRSGGPGMTVQNVETEDDGVRVTCAFFEGKPAELRHCRFKIEMLEFPTCKPE